MSVREGGQSYRLQCVFIPFSSSASSSSSSSAYQDGDDDEDGDNNDDDNDDDEEGGEEGDRPDGLLSPSSSPSSSPWPSSTLTAVVPLTVLPCPTRVIWSQPPPIGNYPHPHTPTHPHANTSPPPPTHIQTYPPPLHSHISTHTLYISFSSTQTRNSNPSLPYQHLSHTLPTHLLTPSFSPLLSPFSLNPPYPPVCVQWWASA